jgi:uncharacterized damage-inducible protein DinB
MSIETTIENLTAAILGLTAALAASTTAAPAAKVEKPAVEKAEKPAEKAKSVAEKATPAAVKEEPVAEKTKQVVTKEEPTTEGPSRDTLVGLIKSKATTHRAEVVAILKSLGAGRGSEVKDADLAAACEALEAVGAAETA